MIAGSIVMVAGQILFMEAPAYWVMCVARALQGVSSTCIWVAGLALMYVFFRCLTSLGSLFDFFLPVSCDVTPEELVGRT